jgi:hypothetical protein
MPRLRQAVIAVSELDRAVEALQSSLSLREPYEDPAIAHFGLRNAVFAIGDTFLELVAPIREGTAAGRQLERRGGDCGYMAMLQVEDLKAARKRARALGVATVFEVDLDDISEVHLHPAQIGGAIVSLSEPRPPAAWRWGGAGWEDRAAAGGLRRLTVAVSDPEAVGDRWREVAGGPIPVEFVADPTEPGIVAVELELGGRSVSVDASDPARAGR